MRTSRDVKINQLVHQLFVNFNGIGTVETLIWKIMVMQFIFSTFLISIIQINLIASNINQSHKSINNPKNWRLSCQQCQLSFPARKHKITHFLRLFSGSLEHYRFSLVYLLYSCTWFSDFQHFQNICAAFPCNNSECLDYSIKKQMIGPAGANYWHLLSNSDDGTYLVPSASWSSSAPSFSWWAQRWSHSALYPICSL